MSPRLSHQWNAQTPDGEDAGRVSRSQRKRDSTALQALGEALTAYSPGALEAVPLSDALRSALVEWRRLSSREGRRRQLQYIGRLMREEPDPEAIREALEALKLVRR